MLVGCPAVSPPTGDVGPTDLVNSVADLQDSTWLVLATSDHSSLTATAFAISETRLVTNAHVVEGIKDILREPNALVGVFQHETGFMREIVRVWTHPEYDADGLQPTPDLGVMSTAEVMPTFVITPGMDAPPSINVLEEVSLCGFPGSVTTLIDLPGAFVSGQFHPRASCLSGNVSALRPFEAGQVLTQANGRLIQYDISTELGLSGSAVFNERGEVIGVHALGLSDDAEQNFAIRSDVLAEMLSWIDRDLIPSVILTEDQFPPWVGFTDVVTGLNCEVVHTDNLELVVSLDPTTGIENLVIVTGRDVRLEDTELLLSNEILFQGTQAGSIVFAEDANGFLALWWVGFGNSVVNVDRFTGEPFLTNRVPADIVVSTCDGCDLWDDPTVCHLITP